MLALRELDTAESRDQHALKRFEECRFDVVHVSSSRILPECIAVTTKGGFIQLVNVFTGSFRVFLTHLGDVPLDSQLRCFSLVPSLYATRGGHSLLYSLAHSNELLLADLERGVVDVLATFHSRPSVVYCDGDYMVCGEGCGQVTLWRSHGTSRFRPKVEWRKSVFMETVVCITLQRGFVFCSSVDQHTYVLSLQTGDTIAKLAQEQAVAVSLLSVAASQLSGGVVLLCLPSVLTVFTPPSDTNVVSTSFSESNVWDCANLVQFNLQVSCLSCCNGLIACGTASGVVILMTINEAGSEVLEQVRFSVGFAVVSVQLFDDNTLVVVTSSGDVWKWATADLLPEGGTYESSGEEKDDEEEVPVPNEHPPVATVVNRVEEPSAKSEVSDCTHSGVICADDGFHLGCLSEHNKEEEVVVVLEDDFRSVPSPASPFPTPPENSRIIHLRDCSNNSKESHHTPPVTEHGQAACAVGCIGLEHESVISGTQPLSPSSLDAKSTTSDGRSDSCPSCLNSLRSRSATASSDATPTGLCNARLPTQCTSSCRHTFHSFDDNGILEATADAGMVVATKRGTSDGSLNLERESVAVGVVDPSVCHGVAEGVRKERSSIEYTLTHTLEKALCGVCLSPPNVIEGLRTGRRMDPRRARSIAENNCRKDPVAVPGKQSSQVLLNYREGLEDCTFDPKAYAEAHALKAEALKYRYPVRMPVYGTHVHLFASSAERCVTNDRERGEADDARSGDRNKVVLSPCGCQQRAPRSTVADDLMDATYGRFTRRRDPLLEEERCLGGPDIRRHSCGGLMCGPIDPSGTVLFQEYRVQPCSPGVLTLPIPLPPTSTVF